MRKDDDLKAEYLLIQSLYEDFDKRALSLKALAAPLLGAGVIVGLGPNGGVAVHTVVIAVATSLWLLEAIWKNFQYALIPRIAFLEGWYRHRAPTDDPVPFQIFAEWDRAWKAGRGHPSAWARTMLQPFVALPYVVIVAASALGIALR